MQAQQDDVYGKRRSQIVEKLVAQRLVDAPNCPSGRESGGAEPFDEGPAELCSVFAGAPQRGGEQRWPVVGVFTRSVEEPFLKMSPLSWNGGEGVCLGREGGEEDPLHGVSSSVRVMR